MISCADDQLALARLHVVEREARRARQAALVARFKTQRFDTAEAEHLLALLDETLVLMRGHQVRLEAERGSQ